MMHQSKNVSFIQKIRSIFTPEFFNPVINMPPIKVVGVLKETKDYENILFNIIEFNFSNGLHTN